MFATKALSGLCVQRVAVLFVISHRSPTEGSIRRVPFGSSSHVFVSILTHVPPPPLNPMAFPVVVSSLLVTL